MINRYAIPALTPDRRHTLRTAFRSRRVRPPLPRPRLSGGALPATRFSGRTPPGRPACRLSISTGCSPRPSTRRRTNSSPAGASSKPRSCCWPATTASPNVCFEVGYESLGSFSTRFHSLTGLSPAAFRGEARRIFGGFGVALAVVLHPRLLPARLPCRSISDTRKTARIEKRSPAPVLYS